METDQLELLKLVLENDLNKETIRRLLQVIRKISSNIYENKEGTKILEIMGNDMEIVKNYYKTIIDSIE